MDTTHLVAEYFARIGYAGPAAPTLATLGALQSAHMQAIPFEHLDVLLGRPMPLDLESVADKLLRRRRGGYCFEHQTLYRAVLGALGFETRLAGGRVYRGASPAVVPPRTHALTVVTLPEGRFASDPGFGGAGPRLPMPLEDGASSSVLGEAHRLRRVEGEWLLERLEDGAPEPLYAFGEDAYVEIDMVVGHHFTSTHPDSRFKSGLIVTRSTPRGAVMILGQRLLVREDGARREAGIPDRDALAAALREHFGIDLPEVRSMRVPSVPGWT